MVVLDTSALLALLRREPGGEAIGALIGNARMGSVNVAEVITKLVEYGSAPDLATRRFRSLRLEIVPFDALQAENAGELWEQTRKFGLSLGDRACLALARTLDAPVYTGDRAWAKLDIGVEVRLFR